MANTYVKIASVTVGSGGASTIDFTSIANTYDDLVVKISARTTNANELDTLDVQFNGSSSSRTERRIRGTGSAADSSTSTQVRLVVCGDNATASTFGNAEIYIPNYAGSTNKSHSADMVTENNNTTAVAALEANLWSNTAAITSISIIASGSTIKQDSTAVLYGIKKS